MIEKQRKRLPVSVSAAVFIEDEKGRLLLLQQTAKWKGQKWSPPAGGMHAFENPIETALREIQEEIGVGVELTGLIGIYTAIRGPTATGIAFVFRGKLTSHNLKLKKGEISQAKYFSPKELQELIKRDQLYKPEYNLLGIKDWLAKINFPLEVIR